VLNKKLIYYKAQPIVDFVDKVKISENTEIIALREKNYKLETELAA
jgi:hypothetical protein